MLDIPILVEGQRIEVRGEQFLVQAVRNLTHGQIVTVQGISELVRYQKLILDTRLESTLRVVNARNMTLRQDTEHSSNRTMLAIETCWRYTAVSAPVITLAGTAGINLADYQRIPTEGALSLPQSRILLADGVGMGKTIQVGMLLAELMRRGRADRILVIALKSILTQFQQELWQRFAIPLKRLDSQGIAQIRSEIPVNKNPFDIFDKSIISIDTLKNDGQFKQKLDKARWDVIVIDECHVVANDGSMRGQLAERLARQCDAMVLTSATPHNGKAENFKNLLDLLDPSIVAASENEVPQREDLQHMVFRRFKHHIADQKIQDQFQERRVEALSSELSANELEVLEKQYELRRHERSRNHKGTELFSITLFKSILSSPRAAIETLVTRLKRHDPQHEQPITDPLEQNLLQEMEKLLNSMLLNQEDTKFQVLVRKLQDLKLNSRQEGNRFVIFSERIKTLEYLQTRLKEAFGLKEEQVPMFHGSLTDTEQQALVESFGRQDSPIKVLLASDSGSQGVNLHYFCHHMFNYDLPWSIITLEQRNGRIDRYGQTQTPYIYYLINKTSQQSTDLETDLRILDRLREKEEQVHRSLGDASSVMKLYDALKEEKLVAKAIALQDESILDKQGTTLSSDDASTTAPSASETEGETDWLAKLFDDEEVTAVSSETNAAVAYAPPTLFTDSFDYYQLLTQVQDPLEVNISVDRGGKTISYQPTYNNEVASRGQQLAQRFRDALPAELFPTKAEVVAFKLTTDKELVMKSIQDARGSQNSKRLWATFQPLYDMHPAVMMMVDKFKASIGSQEIPVGCFRHPVPEPLKNKAFYVCRITQANMAGYNMLDAFRIVQVSLDDYSLLTGANQVLTLEQWAPQVRPTEQLAQFSLSDHVMTSLQDKLPAVVDHVEDLWRHTLLPETTTHLHQLCHAKEERLQTVLTREQLALETSENATSKKATEARLHEAQKQLDQLTSIQTLENNPFIEVLAVWVQGA